MVGGPVSVYPISSPWNKDNASYEKFINDKEILATEHFIGDSGRYSISVTDYVQGVLNKNAQFNGFLLGFAKRYPFSPGISFSRTNEERQYTHRESVYYQCDSMKLWGYKDIAEGEIITYKGEVFECIGDDCRGIYPGHTFYSKFHWEKCGLCFKRNLRFPSLENPDEQPIELVITTKNNTFIHNISKGITKNKIVQKGTTVFLPDTYLGASYSVRNVHGREVKSGNIAQSSSIEFGSLASGIYNVTVIASGREMLRFSYFNAR